MKYEASFCIEAPEEATRTCGAPDIFDTDQGSQFTSEEFTAVLQENGIEIGNGRMGPLEGQRVLSKGLWRSVKYEEVYLKAYESVTDARRGLGAYFAFHNDRRHYQALGGRTPDEVYRETLPAKAAS